MFLALFMSCGSAPKHTVGLTDGLLAPCPDSPNCVSTQAELGDSQHYIAPVALIQGGQASIVLDRAVNIVLAGKRTELVGRDSTTAHLTVTTAVFRWVDDVEFAVDVDAGLLHFRSASRTGYGDMGVNRKRMEAFRAAWQQ